MSLKNKSIVNNNNITYDKKKYDILEDYENKVIYNINKKENK